MKRKPNGAVFMARIESLRWYSGEETRSGGWCGEGTMSSPAEQKLRTRVVERLRDLIPDARIVHELNMQGGGSRRIDVAAVGEGVIVGAEVKSENDCLDRLQVQVEEFLLRCDLLVVAASSKHDFGIKSLLQYSLQREIQFWYDSDSRWDFDPYLLRWQPPKHSVDLLRMLWADEMREVAQRHEIALPRRANMTVMTKELALGMTGRQVKSAVCRALRRRKFADADPPDA